ncbi:MAG: response regulator transcription factor [Bacteroidota bacterium]|nr:response regulator transcription factor [Bacteroidota bacterium]
MKRIILADDHSIIRVGLIQILKDEYPDAEIMEVSNGESLIKEVMKNDWDLVISDLDMPGINGLQALEQIKIIKPQLPVLILSIFTEDLYAVRVLKAGASGYMNKNAAPYELITAIQRILLGRKYITPEIAEKLLATLDNDKKPHELLSNREFEIFKLLANGKSTTYIAEELSLALSTVSTYRNRILEKLDLSSNSDLTRYAILHNINYFRYWDLIFLHLNFFYHSFSSTK